jgi:hypothetical protein
MSQTLAVLAVHVSWNFTGVSLCAEVSLKEVSLCAQFNGFMQSQSTPDARERRKPSLEKYLVAF